MTCTKRNILPLLLAAITLLTGCNRLEQRRMADRALHTADSLDALRQPIAPDTLLDDAIVHYGQRIIVPREKLARAYYYRGRIRSKNNRYTASMQDFVQARRYFTDATPPTLQGRTAVNIAFFCTSQGSDSLALQYYNEALEHFRQAGDTSRMAYTLLDLGGVKLRSGHPDESLEYYRKALPYAKDSLLYGSVLQSIGQTYYNLGQLDSSFYYMVQAVQYPYRNNSMSVRYLHLSYCYYDWGQLDSAAIYAQKAIDHTTDPNIHNSAYYILMDWAKQQNDLNTNDQYSHNRADAMNLIKERQNALASAVQAIPLELSKREIIHLEKRQYILLLALIVCIGSACCLWYRLKAKERHNRLKYELGQKRLLLEQEELLQQAAKREKEQEQRLKEEKQRERQERFDLFCRQVDMQDLQLWKNWDLLEKEANLYLNGFFIHLEKTYPKIDTQDKQLCLLILLDYSYKEIGERLNLSPESISKTKGRLAPKIGCSIKEMKHYLFRFIG